MSTTTYAATDESARGFAAAPVDALRYDGQPADPAESTGLLLEMIPVGARVLDVGCGTGSVTKLVIDARKADVVGIEPNADRAATAASRGINVHCGVLTSELSATLGKFDVVMFADVLEHLPDPLGQLMLAQDYLRPGARVIASVPNIAHWTVRRQLLLGRFDYSASGIMDATHLRWFTQESIARLFVAAGMKPVRQSVSAGTWMHEYLCQRPWRWIEPQRRNKLIHLAARKLPKLFGCQHVICAVRAQEKSEDESSQPDAQEDRIHKHGASHDNSGGTAKAHAA